jgi:hypothetical protein
MKPLAIALMLVACTAAFAAGPTDDLVDAAKDAKAKRRKSTSKVITNADVKKSKAKIATTAAPTAPVTPEPTMMEKHVATRAAEAVATARKTAAEALVKDLEKELVTIEQRYYEENDLDRRDTEIVKRFNDVKSRLDAARDDLAALGSQFSGEGGGPAS